jgi:hypothetical protein
MPSCFHRLIAMVRRLELLYKLVEAQYENASPRVAVRTRSSLHRAVGAFIY